MVESGLPAAAGNSDWAGSIHCLEAPHEPNPGQRLGRFIGSGSDSAICVSKSTHTERAVGVGLPEKREANRRQRDE